MITSMQKKLQKNSQDIKALLENLALYDNESWNDPRDFTKPVKAVSMPQDVPSTSDRYLIELENYVQHLMEAYLAHNQPIQVKKIASSCKICSGPHDTQYCMENSEQAFIEYASLRIDEAGGLLEEIKDVLGLATGTKSYLVGIVKNVEVYVGKLRLFEDFHIVDTEREPTCHLLVGRGFLATANVVIDYKKAKIAAGEGLTRSIFGVRELDFGEENVPYWTTIGKRESYKTRTSEDDIGARPLTLQKETFETIIYPKSGKLLEMLRENNRILEEILRTLKANSLVDVKDPEGSDDYMKVTYDKEQCLSGHYTAPVTPPPLAYTPTPPV
ncbi:MAK10-like protein [Tanacetum coccineum]